MSAEPTTVIQAYRFALDPTPAQARALASHVGAARFAFNRMLAEVKADIERYHAGEPTLLEGWSLPALRRHWNARKHTWAVNAETGEPWWAENSKEAYSSGLAALADALGGWRASRAGARKGPPMRFPRFRKRSRRMGVRFTTGAIRVEADRTHVVLPRLGRVKTHESTRKLARRVEAATARILAATVSCDAAGRWQVAFTVEVHRQTGRGARPGHARRLAPVGVAVGVDVGVADLVVAATADGAEVLRIAAPRALGKAQARLARLQRTQARQQPGSRRRRRTMRRIGRVHARAANIRRDVLAKATTRLAQGCDTLVVEDLGVAGMARRKRGLGARGRGFNRAVADASLAQVRRMLAYKTRWYGSELIVADRWYPSSKTCSSCGAAKATLALDERTYHCEPCGLAVDRDRNAAVNLARLSDMRPAGSGPVAGRGAKRETEAVLSSRRGWL